uniref:IS1 family transposase n=1 Tax=Endozoicomonas gorgoniicola TaxID=1234144 RepID=UPI00389958AF
MRTRLKRLMRKTTCFSRSVKIHDKVIGEFISREHSPESTLQRALSTVLIHDLNSF